MSFVERTLMIQKYIQYLRLIGLGKGRIFLHILIHVLDGVREFVVNILAVSFYISCLQEGDGKRFFAGLLRNIAADRAAGSRVFDASGREQMVSGMLQRTGGYFAGRADCAPDRGTCNCSAVCLL